MKNTYLWAAVLLVLIIGGGYWYMQQAATENAEVAENDLGSYPYLCDDGSAMVMTPATDLSFVTVKIFPGNDDASTETTLTFKDGSAGQRFEGDGIVFVGAGEEVLLTVGNSLTICNPTPNSDMAPWNWGDAGEGGGIKQDVTVIVSESIIGKWQSTDDATFVREFQAGGKVVDSSNGKAVSSGTYVAFSKDKPVTVSFPLQADAVYIQMTMQGTQAEKLNFKLNKLTPEELELTYMDRGGVLKFRAVQ